MKLHESLAIEGDLRTQAETCRKDLANTFEKKVHHFTKKTVTFKPSTEGAQDKVESQLDLQTSVKQEIKWISEKLAKAIDAGHQVDVANTTAAADVVLDDGTVLLSSVPTTSLLRLEHRIVEIRSLIHAIPTLDPAKGFAPDPDQGDGIFKARNDERPRTEKKFEFVVMVPSSDKHPAQVKELMADRPIGTIVTQEWSSLITVAEKGNMLDRVEDVLRAVKKARARANDAELDTKKNKIADPLLNFVFGNGNGA
jgi:hypothetical protein